MTNDLDRDLRELFERHEADLLGREIRTPTDVTRRVRQRQVRSVVVVALATAVMIAGTTAGVGALLRAREGRPAEPPSPTPSPSPLLPPTDASIVVGTGSVAGWDWLLSTSADGTCVALTDAQGSETSCADLPTGNRPETRVTTAVWSPQPPAPSVLFVFGRVPAETAQVSMSTSRYDQVEGELLTPVDGLGFDGRYYVGWVVGYEHPFVPDVWITALDDADEFIGFSLPLERPDWASEPTGTVIEVLGSGTKHVVQDDNEDKVGAFEITIFTDDATGRVCLGEIDGVAVCGPADAPVPAWEAAIASYCELPDAAEASCAWPLSVQDGLQVAQGKEIIAASWGWGLAKDPIVAVRVERYVFSGPDDSSAERDGWLDAGVVDLPEEYAAPFKVWIYSCDDCIGPTVGFDAEGNEIARTGEGN